MEIEKEEDEEDEGWKWGREVGEVVGWVIGDRVYLMFVIFFNFKILVYKIKIIFFLYINMYCRVIV